MVRHHAILYRDLTDPVGLLRGEPADTELSRYWAYARSTHPSRLSDDRVADYTALMAASQTLIAAEVLDAYPIARHRRLLDVGGGDGTFLTAAAARAPRLSLILFDLPPVADRAKARFATMDVSSRMNAVGGDFLSGQLPRGADLVTLIRVLHDHDDNNALALLRVIRQALPADGALLIAEPMSETPGSEAVGDAYFGFYLLAMRSGRPRTQERITELLREAGFTRARPIRTKSPLLVCLLAAQP
jgi:demethylspheroidene O-methyltransferase